MSIPQLERIPVKVKFVNVRYDSDNSELVGFFMYKHANLTPSNLRGYWLRDGYTRIGQHGQWSESYLRCKPATKDQYKDLLREMTGLGYDITVMNKDK